MRKNIRFLLSLLLLLALFPFAASANSAEPPCFTVLVIAPPQGLTLSLDFPDHPSAEAAPLYSQRKGWEGYYRFYYHSFPQDEAALASGPVLAVSWPDHSFRLPVTEKLLTARYNNVLTLDLEKQVLTAGEPLWRTPVLVGFRVALTLLIEGVVLFLMGYRQRKSWTIFLLVNLFTQGGLNLLLNRTDLLSSGAYWLIGYGIMEFVIFWAEAFAYALLLREKGSGRAVATALAANTASLILGGFLLSRLPI